MSSSSARTVCAAAVDWAAAVAALSGVDVGSGVDVSVGSGVAVGAGVSVGADVAVGGSAVGGVLQACSTSSKRITRYSGRFMVFSFLKIDTISLSHYPAPTCLLTYFILICPTKNLIAECHHL